MNRRQRRAQEKLAAKAGPVRTPVQLSPAQQAALRDANRLNDEALNLYHAGDTARALDLLRQAIAAFPQNAIYYNNLGELLRLGGDAEAALAQLDRAIALAPRYAEAHNNRGNALRDLKRPAEAIPCYEAAIAIRPDYADAMSNLGAALLDCRDFAAAIAALQRAVALNPQNAIYQQNLGLALIGLGRETEAETALKTAIRLAPKMIDTVLALGDVERIRGDIDAALRWYEQAWQAAPGHGEAHLRYGVAKLVKGDYREAWPHFGARWTLASMEVDKRPFTLPFWQGQALPAGGRLLLLTEQGVGENLVLLSLLPELLARGITPVVECDPRMLPLLERSFPGIEAYGRRNPANQRLFQNDLVMQASLFDLAAVLRRSPEDCTGALPLRADAGRATALRAQYLAGRQQPLIGLAWYSGNPRIGAPKSAQLVDFAPFLSLPGLCFVDLQYGNREADRAALKAATGVDVIYDPAIDQMADLDAFAAQVAAMDMVITTSNTTAHMAAALGKPTWVLLHKGISPHWYWGLTGETTPWYPTARLLRQRQASDWRGLAESVAEQLKAHLAATTS
ncbi:MAG TPA: tetratricopeptide repeat protein [Ferrovibrio sp.]|uniref:tetratricopeptide repeat protein n=1 Tax=Ferrovibrio sp. TaxID=1917215 RepID=UPI002ED234C0